MSFRTSGAPALLAGNAEFAVAKWGPALISLWRGEPTVARALQLEHACAQAFAEPGVDLFLQIVEASSPVPNADARAISARVTRNHIRRLRAAAHVVEGDTFRVQLVRTVLRGMSLLVKNDLPQLYCADDRAAAEWLAETVHPSDAVARERLRVGLLGATGWIREQVDTAKKSDSLRPSSIPASSRRPVSEAPAPLPSPLPLRTGQRR